MTSFATISVMLSDRSVQTVNDGRGKSPLGKISIDSTVGLSSNLRNWIENTEYAEMALKMTTASQKSL